MGLIILPRRETLAATDPLPKGLTHPEGTACPFALTPIPRGPTCCSLDGERLIDALRAFGEGDWAEVLATGTDLDVDYTLILGPALRSRARAIEYQYEGQRKWNGRRLVQLLNLATGKLTPWPSDAVEKLSTVNAAANWFETVGRFGFGVQIKP